MPVTVAQVQSVLTADTKQHDAAIKASSKGLTDFTEKGKKDTKSLAVEMAKDFHTMAMSVKASIAVMATAFIKDGVQRIVKGASELGDSMAKVDTIFGKSAESVKKWSENTDKALGLSRKAALDTVGTIGQLYQNMGIAEKASAQMSTKLVQLAVDLAALNNIGTEEAMDRIKRGVRGSAEALDELGLSFNANMVKQKAYSMGLAEQGEKLTEATKAQAIYALMMEQGAKVSGQFARESETLAAQTKMLQAEVENLAADIGEDLVPMVRDLVKWTRDDLLPELRDFGHWVVDITKNLPAAITELKNMADPFNVIAGIAERAAGSFKALAEWTSLWVKVLAEKSLPAVQAADAQADYNILSEAAKRVGGMPAAAPVHNLTPEEIEAGNRHGLKYSPLAGGAGIEANTVLEALKKARENALGKANQIRANMRVDSMGEGMEAYIMQAFGMSPAGTSLPDLGTPGNTPQATDPNAAQKRADRIADMTKRAIEETKRLLLDAYDFEMYLAKRNEKELVQAGVNKAVAHKLYLAQVKAAIYDMVKDVGQRVKQSGLEDVVMPYRGGGDAMLPSRFTEPGIIGPDVPSVSIHRNAGLRRTYSSAARITDPEGNKREAQAEAFALDMVRSARRASRNFLQALFGNDRDRRGAIAGLIDDLKKSLIDSFFNLNLNLTPLFQNLGKTLQSGLISAVNAAIAVAQTGIGQMLGAVYQLLSALGRKGGFGITNLIGGALGFAFAGWQGAAYGANALPQLVSGDIGGFATSTIVAGATGTFGKVGPIGGSGGNGGFGPDYFSGGGGWGRSRSASVIYTGPVTVNERADLARLNQQTVRLLDLAVSAG